ncbi:MAG: hypothetical protein J1F64_00035 [Oscillospiraceae bacterium]|nr:hypothetical protein [Oscillospiraceae bacterium]
MAAAKKAFMYRGKPIIRKGDRIFYGNLDDRYILTLTVLEAAEMNGVNAATKVKVEIQDNDGVLGTGKTYRKTERENLYRALDIGTFWLSEALES